MSELQKRRASEANTTHGGRGTTEYNSWTGMIQRCENPNHPRYADYGGRGIKVCRQWRQSFATFIKDMGKKPAPRMQVERRDNDGPYDPKNCYWATRKQQANNTRASRFLEFDGQSLTISQWADKLGVRASTLQLRLAHGWSVQQTMTIPVSASNKIHAALLNHNGETLPLAEWARRAGISHQRLRWRLNHGWSVYDSIQSTSINATEQL